MKKALFSIFLLLVFTSFAYSELNIELLGILEGENNGDHFGYCVANLGDINGDGFQDFAVGAPDYPASQDSGRVYIYLGAESRDLNVDLVLETPEGVKWFGASVCGLPDVTGDGCDEFLVGAWDYRVFLYLGGDPPDNVPDRIYWEPMYGYGSDLASGDVNNDGFSDFVVAGGGDDTAYVYLGSEEMDTIPDFVLCGDQIGMDGLAMGDVNGDQFDDIIATVSWLLNKTYVFLGGDSLSSEPDVVLPDHGQFPGVGDINNDGYDDIMYHYLVYFGSAQLDTVYDLWLRHARVRPRVGYLNRDVYGDIVACNYGLFTPSSANIYLGGDAVDTVLDWRYVGGYWDNFAYDIDCVDLNADGVDEILISSPSWPDARSRGRVHVFAGDTTATFVQEEDFMVRPDKIYLSQNYPNPFNSSTTIRFSVNGASPIGISLKIYDLQGRLVKELFSKPAIPGVNRVAWDGTNNLGEKVSSGIYFITLKTEDILRSRKAIFIR